MALIAHYPLNGDTKDYSGYGNDGSIKGTVANILVSEAGKIGKCYETTKVSGGGYIQSDREINLGTEQSMFAWVNIEALSSASALNGLVDQHRVNGNSAANPSSGMGITAAYLSASNYKVSCSTSNKNGGRTYNHYRGETVLDTSKWYHLGYTYESNSGLLKFYVNGLLDGTHTLNFDMNVVADTIRIFGWNASSSYQGKQKLNDIRIYDHALSDKEVKEIAKAKVLHYKFDEHEEPTTNVWSGNLVIYNNLRVPATLVDTGKSFKGAKILRLGMTVDSANSSHLGSFRSAFHSHGVYGGSMTFLANTKYAASILWRPVNKNDVVVGGTASNISGWVSKGSQYEGDGWNRFTVVRTGSVTTNQSDNMFFSFICPSMQLNETVFVEFCAPQVEVGKDYSTPYVLGTRRGGVKDSSGFRNDGTVAAATAPSWSEDSPVGRGSMEFDGSLITTGKIFYNSEQTHTISAWVKPANIGISNQQLVNFHQGYRLIHSRSNSRSLMYMNSGANDHYVYGNSLTENKWTLVTWVYDKSNLRCQVYYDGVLNASSSNFTATNVPSGFSATTIFGTNFVGNISDIRIYATALSPEDILEIYQTRASVDNEGNLFIQEIDEITNTSKEVDNRGIAKFKEFNEVDGENKMSIKNDGVVYVNEIMEA